MFCFEFYLFIYYYLFKSYFYHFIKFVSVFFCFLLYLYLISTRSSVCMLENGWFLVYSGLVLSGDNLIVQIKRASKLYNSGSQSVVRKISLVVRRGISELNINQAACPPK